MHAVCTVYFVHVYFATGYFAMHFMMGDINLGTAKQRQSNASKRIKG
jgi:hypothetical protein